MSDRSTPPLDGPPTRAPRIESQGELARGGMSWIRRVHDRLLERDAAMKVLDQSLAHPQLLARFVREAQVLAQLDHPHIVPLYELATDDDGTPCFTMKLIEGKTLTEVVQEQDLLADPRGLHQALDILLKVCDALAFAHGRGVLAELELARVGYVKPPQDVVPARALPRGLCTVAMRALRQELERFLRGGSFQSVRFAPGEVIIREQEPGDAAYIITQGRCEASKIEAGRKINLRTMAAGDLFGETAILTGALRTATVTALDDVTVLAISRDALDEWLALDSWMGTLVKNLAERFRDVDAQLTQQRKSTLELHVREQLLAAVARTGRAAWKPLCARLCAETQLTELDLLAIAAGSDHLALDQATDTLRLSRQK